MITISLCMIVKNESKVLSRCLDSIAGAVDEIIVVDTGSSDNTKDIAVGKGAKVFDFPWCDDFSAARNFSFSQASMDYIMWLDADDVVEVEDFRKLQELKKNLTPEISVVNMAYNAAFDPQGQPTFTYQRERLLRRRDNYRWEGAVHEVITPRGSVLNTDIAISHKKTGSGDPDRNLRIYEKQLAEGKTLNAREKFYYARELMYHSRWHEAIAVFSDFLHMEEGWLENRINACGDMARCYRSLGDDRGEIESLVKSFSFDCPRAEICCDIGNWWMRRSGWFQGKFWYKQALECDPDQHPGAFVMRDCYGYIPYMQLTVIYDKLGLREKAIDANEKAGKIRPNDPSYLHNKEYFAK